MGDTKTEGLLLYMHNYSFYSQKGVEIMDVAMERDYAMPRVELNEEPSRDPKDKLLDVLDRIEAHVEDLRKESLRLEERKDALFTTLDTIRNSDHLSNLSETDKDDIQRYIERVTARCMTVDISVRTDRDKQQEEALYQVNKLIDNLVISFKSEPDTSMVKCQSFLAACQDEPEVPVDKMFELSLLGCALDDQKRVKKRLCGLLDYLGQGRFMFVSNDVKDEPSGSDMTDPEDYIGFDSPPTKRRKPTSDADGCESQEKLVELLARQVRLQKELMAQVNESIEQQSSVIKMIMNHKI